MRSGPGAEGLAQMTCRNDRIAIEQQPQQDLDGRDDLRCATLRITDGIDSMLGMIARRSIACQAAARITSQESGAALKQVGQQSALHDQQHASSIRHQCASAVKAIAR